MHGDDHLGLDPGFHGKSCILRPHGEVAANRREHEVGFVVFADELHVAKQAGVAHVPNFETVFHFNNEAHGLACRVRFVFAGGGVFPNQ